MTEQEKALVESYAAMQGTGMLVALVRRLDAENERMRDELGRLLAVVGEVDHESIRRVLAGK